MKTLYLLRHAKAEPGSTLLRDEDRPLAARGREACKHIGGYMRAKGYTPSLVLCSHSTRTRETMELVAENHRGNFPYVLEKKLYLAAPEEMLAHIHAVDNKHASLMLIGHNPGMHHIAALLASAEHTPLREKLEIKYPTGSLAVIAFDTQQWSAIAPDSGRLMDFVVPNEL